MKMKNISLIIFLMLSGINFSQTTHDVTVQNFSFSPQSLTITVGDIVRWTNISGTHNVKADDNSFTSGPAAPAPWEYTHTFTAAGNNPYYCEPHQGMGMTGTIIVQNPVGVSDDELIAEKFELKQNYPNPFNPSTNIEFRISDRSFVSLKVFNILGDEVASLINEEKAAGIYSVTFNASNLSSGMYLYKIQSGSFVETKKMILMK
jgi:plastocyanin